jgi:hypothetical protein
MQRTLKGTSYVGVALGIAVLAALLFRDMGATSAARPQTPQTLITMIQLGVGTGCPFGGNAGPTEIVNNLASFLSSRSGIVLSQAVKNRLITLETQTMYGGRPKKHLSTISTAFCDTFLERVGQLTDAQIYEIGDCTRTAVDIPFNNSPGVMARTTGQLTMSSMGQWMSKACAYRDSSTSEAVTARAATPGAIYNATDQRVHLYQEALPDQWNLTGFTPVQAFLLGYSVLTDDGLQRSPAGLTQQMQALETYIHQNLPTVQTSCANRKPFGYMGYLYSTHTTHLFNETVQNRLIDRL